MGRVFRYHRRTDVLAHRPARRQEMQAVVKIPLEVTPEQAAILDSQSKIANWLYNQLLEQANALRKQYRETQDKQVGLTLYTQRGLRNLIPGLKGKHPFLKV